MLAILSFLSLLSLALSANVLTTTWNIDDTSMKAYNKAGQSLSLSFHVTGTNHMVVWVNQPLWAQTVVKHPERYAIFATQEVDYDSGDVVIVNSLPFEVNLGNTYTWKTGNGFTLTGPSGDGRIHIVNGDTGTSPTFLNFGVMKFNPTSGQFSPICVDPLGLGQTARYTPLTTIYASVGSTYTTSTIIADIGNFDKFTLAGDASFTFDPSSSDWKMN
jgi:hypothetical protein